MAQNGPNPTGAPFELIDGYRVERYISKGSYGEVYQATRTYYPSPRAGFLCGLQQAHNDEFNADIGVVGSPTYINPHPELAAQQRGGGGVGNTSAFAFYSGASGSTIPQNQQQLQQQMPEGAAGNGAASAAVPPSLQQQQQQFSSINNNNNNSAHAVGAANAVSTSVIATNGQGAATTANGYQPSSRHSTPPPLTINTNIPNYNNSAVPPALAAANNNNNNNGGAALAAAVAPRTQRVAIKVVRDYARRGTNVQGSDRYVSRYTKKIAREVQLLQYFNGCKEFVPVLDMYLSADKQDLYIIMKMFDYSLYTYVRHEVALKKQKEEEERMRASPTKRTRVDSTGQPLPPATPVKKGLRRIFDEKKTKLLTVQLLSGLGKMAAVGAAHRDLSSGNVLYDPKTHRAAICDFGLSRANISAKMAQTTNVVTAPYRSPELLLLINKYDARRWTCGPSVS